MMEAEKEPSNEKTVLVKLELSGLKIGNDETNNWRIKFNSIFVSFRHKELFSMSDFTLFVNNK